ncbi:MAG: D-tyrosyl-tRNA(Tyr) deacylase [Bacteroidales bacterium]|nr:D-tyrosyl-tRNA(Tyr) deacylase [Bacteroidales bacterium]
MRAVIQRVQKATVTIYLEKTAEIEQGLLILLGIEEEDSREDIDWLAGKISRLRIFDDQQGVMNLSIQDTKGDILVVSQFTLYASTKKGNRPSYIKAARPETSEPIYKTFVETLSELIQQPVKTGKFGAEMQISLVNDGPVTILIDTKNKE